MRHKVVFSLLTLPPEMCNIPDSVVADFMTWDKSEKGRPVVTFKFCPWCGAPWARTGEIQEAT